MSEFNKDDYLNDLPDADQVANSRDESAPAEPESQDTADSGSKAESTSGETASAQPEAPESGNGKDHDQQSGQDSGFAESGTSATSDAQASSETNDDSDDSDDSDENTLTALGQAKKEAAEYLDALQRERAEFVNFRNRSRKDQDLFRQHGIIDVLTAMLPALDDIDRIREHGDLDESFNAVASKIDKTFKKFGVEKFGEKGEDFDPTKHEAILHRPDAKATSETVDTVVEAGYRIGDRVVRAARVVVVSPQD